MITCFIRYESDDFEFNWVNVYVWYGAVSMFVNVMK